MFLRSIRLRNIRSLRNIYLDFGADEASRKWTILLGENGCGKSTLLRAIGLLMAGSEALPGLVGDPRTWVANGTKDALIEGTISTAAGDERKLAIRFTAEDNIRTFFSRNKKTLDALDAALKMNRANYLTMGYGASRRINIGKKEVYRSSSLHPRAEAMGTLFFPEADLSSVEAWAFDVHYRHDAAGLNLVEKTLRDLLPGVVFKGIDRTNRELIFETAEGRVPLSLLSDGYQNMTAWCGDMLYRITEAYGHYENPLSARGLLMVDEVDLHLHPIWQKQLRQFLDEKLPNLQIIATTHSPLTAHQTGEGELYFLRRDGVHNSVVLHEYPGAARNLMLHQVLLSPAFGLRSLDSTRVEEMKNEYRALKAKKSHTPAESKRVRELSSVLETMPEWTTLSSHDREKIALLRDVEDRLPLSSRVAEKRTSRSRK